MALATMPLVARLHLASVTLPEWHPAAATDRTCPVYGFVIDHPDGAIVVDTGVGLGNAFLDATYDPQVQPLDAALIAEGIDPRTVVAVVNSHLHFDHCGQNPLFHGSAASVFVQQAELDAVDRDPFYTDSSWALAPSDQQEAIEGDLAIAEGVTILATPGHTAGHQSVLVESRHERLVIAGQIVWRSREYLEAVATSTNVADDELRDAALDSIRRVKALRPQTVFFSHCDEHRSEEPAP